MLALLRPRDSWQLICIYIDIRWRYTQCNSSWCVSWHSLSVSWVRPHSSNTNVSHLFFLYYFIFPFKSNIILIRRISFCRPFGVIGPLDRRVRPLDGILPRFNRQNRVRSCPLGSGWRPWSLDEGMLNNNYGKEKKKKVPDLIDKISFFHPGETIDWSTFDSVEFNLRKKIKKEKREKKIKSEWTRFTVGESINTESIGRRTGGSGSVPRGAAVTSHITLYMESIQLWSQVYSKALPTSASMLSSLRGLFTFQKQPRYSPNFLHPVRFFKAERIKVSGSFLNRNNWTRSRAFWWHSRGKEKCFEEMQFMDW